jgi:hypothetical protein
MISTRLDVKKLASTGKWQLKDLSGKWENKGIKGLSVN